MGRQDRLDLRIRDGGCGDWLSNAQSWMAICVLYNQA